MDRRGRRSAIISAEAPIEGRLYACCGAVRQTRARGALHSTDACPPSLCVLATVSQAGGHPDLAYYVADVTGDPRDEIIVWGARSVWIYTPDRPFTGSRIYTPTRNPDYNESNYRTTVSMPGWKTVK